LLAYVGLEIGIHGLSRSGGNPPSMTVDEVVERVRKALVAEFNPQLEGDIQVEAVEHAGEPDS
jgi:hypothetical protein